MYGFTLGRTIDVNYPTNRWLIITIIAVILGAWPYTGSILLGMTVGLGFFLCWALAREIDPAHDLSAFVAGGFYLLSIPVFDGLQLAFLFYVLLLLRFISGICGRGPTLADQAALFALTVYLLVSRESGIYGLFLALALLLALPKAQDKPVLQGLGKIAVVVSLVASAFWPWQAGLMWEYALLPGILALSVLMLVSAIFNRALAVDQGMQDDRGRPLPPYRVRRAHAFYSAVVLAVLLLETFTLATYVLLASVLLGTGVYRLLVCLKEGSRSSA